jgi:hypothetical protein
MVAMVRVPWLATVAMSVFIAWLAFTIGRRSAQKSAQSPHLLEDILDIREPPPDKIILSAEAEQLLRLLANGLPSGFYAHEAPDRMKLSHMGARAAFLELRKVYLAGERQGRYGLTDKGVLFAKEYGYINP